MQGFMTVAIIGTEKDTLVFYWTQIVAARMDGQMDERTDGKLNSNIAPCYKQVR